MNLKKLAWIALFFIGVNGVMNVKSFFKKELVFELEPLIITAPRYEGEDLYELEPLIITAPRYKPENEP